MFTVVGSTKYPDGSSWHVIMSGEMRDGMLYRSSAYFAPQMPAPILSIIGAGAVTAVEGVGHTADT